MSTTVVKNDIVGSSYDLSHSSAPQVDSELTLNMFYEPLKKQNSSFVEGYLRSVPGSDTIVSADFSLKIGCRGLFTTTRSNPDDGYSGQGNLWAAFGNKIYYADAGIQTASPGEGTWTEVDGSLTSESSPVSFAESGGLNPELLIAEGTTNLRVIPEKDAVKVVKLIPNPVNPYTSDSGNPEGKSVVGDIVANMANRVFMNDRGTGQIFISRVGAFQGGTLVNTIYDLDSEGKIQYEPDGYSPKYKTVDADSYAWKSDLGAYQYTTALSTQGDVIVSMQAINDNILWVLGRRSYDVWQVDSSDASYTITNTAFGRNIGCAAAHSVAYTNGSLYWLGSGADGHASVWATTGTNYPTKISTPPLDAMLAKLSDISDAIGFGYVDGGHTFYVLTFRNDNVTIVYDATTGFWHNRSTHNDLQDIDLCWWPLFATNFGTVTFLGTALGPELVRMNPLKWTEYDGRRIKRLRRCTPLVSEFSPVIMPEFKLLCGCGNTKVLQPVTDGHTTEGYNPSVLLRYSHDGLSFSSYLTGHTGLAGNYAYECRFFRLGSGRLFVIEVVFTDPCDFYIYSSKMRYTVSAKF